ncbi:class I SAM-dependent methyltransferase [Actinomadura harenae]|uniref:Class I SAM-dependent methyltransferase n=1 Tax=Actinomadura harenae TaxID=2483351 RepID=A0A3M2LVJ6_9ACTN|nr:class I SAM-dependent methyltransferase [Actinomadura harenae]RMI41519.1 class I SAM-dependent methyltransferase [Actinomadura harenae]
MDARGWDERYSGRDLVWSADPNRFVAEECAGLAPGRALDVACGEGRNALWLAELGWTVTGVDFSAVAIARARELAETRGISAEFLVEDVIAWEPPSEAFDLVVIAYLQLPEIGGVLARASEALAPGGVLVFVGHDRTNLTEGVGGPQDPAVLHTPADVTAALPGLTVQRAERVRRPVEVDGEERFAVDTLVRAVRPPRT